MTIVHGGEVVAECLKRAGVKYVFTLNGGHIYPIQDACLDRGIELIHVRHEQATTYAADAWARATGKVGVCVVTAGPGLTNAVTGIATAYSAQSPVVVLAGQHYMKEDRMGALEELYGVELCKGITKWSHRVTTWNRLPFMLESAFREASASPPGPALVEIPLDVVGARNDDAQLRYRDPQQYNPRPRPYADPELVKMSIDLLDGAARPLIVAGDGVFWSGAAGKLQELAEFLSVPVYCVRMGLGSIPSEHPLSVQGRFLRKLSSVADLILAVDVAFWWGMRFGQPPLWNERTKVIQVSSSSSELGRNLSVEVGILGDPKSALGQMVAYAKERSKPGPRKEWLGVLDEARRAFKDENSRLEQEFWNSKPIHPVRLAREVVDFIDKDATIIFDGANCCNWLRGWLNPQYPGQIIDAGPHGGVGHGIAMAMAAQLARPGKQVIDYSGDGAFGIGGMEIETALRYKLPIMVIVSNNDGWGFYPEQRLLWGEVRVFAEVTPGLRYDKVGEALGCHGEHVEEPGEIRGALRRASESGLPSVINVVVDKSENAISDLIPSVVQVMPETFNYSERYREGALRGYGRRKKT